MDYTLTLVPLLSLSKVYPDTPPVPQPARLTAAQNERVSFQVAYRLNASAPMAGPVWLDVRVKGDLAEFVTLKQVGYVPSDMPAYPAYDAHYERVAPGLFPDPLYPLPKDGLPARDLLGWRSVWMMIEPRESGRLPVGHHDLEVEFVDTADNTCKATQRFSLDVLETSLPDQTLIYTCWFHGDCLCNYYGIEAFSPAFWEKAEAFFRLAAAYGQNALIMPLVTLPLDTQIGKERLTVQLLDIAVNNGAYTFGFDKVKKWIDLARECGLKYIEVGHLFTQWGAAHAPKVMATVDGVYQRIFGWETEARSAAYVDFLRQMLTAFKAWAVEEGFYEACLFHVSDEPSIEHKEAYLFAKQLLLDILGADTPIYDALSDFDLYQQGIVPNPIVANNHIQPFIDAGVEDLWTYYCCGQSLKVSNRFMAMPAYRTRIIGIQMYKYKIKGFLQWGLNFYNSQLSREPINPFTTTDAGAVFPSGDAFVVYPGKDGPIESLRMVLFYEGLCDYRACKLLESLTSYAHVVELLEAGLDQSITFDDYPHSAEYMYQMRQRLYGEIQKHLS